MMGKWWEGCDEGVQAWPGIQLMPPIPVPIPLTRSSPGHAARKGPILSPLDLSMIGSVLLYRLREQSNRSRVRSCLQATANVQPVHVLRNTESLDAATNTLQFRNPSACTVPLASSRSTVQSSRFVSFTAFPSSSPAHLTSTSPFRSLNE